MAARGKDVNSVDAHCCRGLGEVGRVRIGRGVCVWWRLWMLWRLRVVVVLKSVYGFSQF